MFDHDLHRGLHPPLIDTAGRFCRLTVLRPDRPRRRPGSPAAQLCTVRIEPPEFGGFRRVAVGNDAGS